MTVQASEDLQPAQYPWFELFRLVSGASGIGLGVVLLTSSLFYLGAALLGGGTLFLCSRLLTKTPRLERAAPPPRPRWIHEPRFNIPQLILILTMPGMLWRAIQQVESGSVVWGSANAVSSFILLLFALFSSGSTANAEPKPKRSHAGS